MREQDAVKAVRRFGLGARQGEIARVAQDPRGYLLAALADPGAARLEKPDLQASFTVFAEVQEASAVQRLAAALAQQAKEIPRVTSPPPLPGTMAKAASPLPMADPTMLKPLEVRRNALVSEIAARIEHGIATEHPLLERLVMFWSNHFCVSSAKGLVAGLAGGYEREAIRPHILGRFADMLRAVEQHPAMLLYLDNQASTGPNSRGGRGRGKGLNENLAREILELHTLGVDGGYSQEDVTNLARIITGWSVGQQNIERSEPGKFFFAAARHEPGAWTVMGKSYPDEGRTTGEKVLDDLARHPATARHLATKLARHFVSDRPPPKLVAKLEAVFLQTNGDLGQVTKALVSADEAWSPPATKVVPPLDFVISMLRGLGLKSAPAEVQRLSNLLGQPLWQPPSPKGWPDDDNAWMSPATVRERLRMTERLVRDVDRAIDPRTVAADLLGASLSEPTRQAIARAETREQGLELLVMSPEFLRR